MLRNKIAVVTGGSQGIGLEICKIFAQNGASIAVVDINPPEKLETAAQEIAQSGVQVKTYQCNVADSKQVAEVCKQILTDFGKVDILVNNAGITKDI